ncbi:hypothetical protein LS73_003790 [Helicobacter muridarum]|uniref:Integral membrane protein n=1 Tax=Helicobacter muridarum TaxID=216 RepID=A0A099U193_9HELI|nr:hypothetical protein [Helicobacter muridarum]TLE00781.1 hypothetical protein LS73_003790 [Helicobacter muridarum]STQ86535.1 integral membrane protein [Helicobacter muridarum]
MIPVLKIFFACFVGAAWYHLNGEQQAPVALILSVMVLLAFFMRPVKYQDPKERDAYRLKIQEARERKRLIEEKQLEEKKALKKQAMEAEEARKQELRNKLKI